MEGEGSKHLFSLLSFQHAHHREGRLAAGCGEQGQTPALQGGWGCAGAWGHAALLLGEPVHVSLRSCFQCFLISWPFSLLMNTLYWHGCRRQKALGNAC